VVGTARYCVPDRGVTWGLSRVNPAGRHVVAQQSRFKSCLPVIKKENNGVTNDRTPQIYFYGDFASLGTDRR